MPANTARYSARRRRAIAEGAWTPRGDSRAVRVHMDALREHGALFSEIAMAAGLHSDTVEHIAKGASCSGATADAILSVTPERVRSASVPANGTMLRLRALACMGWTPTRVANEWELSVPHVRKVITGDVAFIPRDMRDDIWRAYEAWWDETPSETNEFERRSASAARGRAEREGWTPPMGLDDDLIDMPGYKPARRAWIRAKGAGVA